MSTSKVNEGPNRGIIQRMRECFGRFARNRDGATAIEFTILALPFAALTFAILETCISFTAQEVLANATDDIARQIRTGQLRRADITEVILRQIICDRLEIIVANGCPDLVIELQNSATFEEAARKAKLTMQNNDIVSSGVNPGGALTINTLNVSYKWPVITDFMRKAMSNLKDGKTLLFSTASWRNEPFDE
ncbi:TadE/TadG family type IV pilus assembly protein [Mesorhizobium sp. BAC0120]|uniref:TadE/TadG family type IV pilus assembly protein n=1 Tax=Mesorhizobium sp. BAC0120 TaxID=3090670 RepID=UPI00298C5F43|nr:TadE/TadG family type IV pilus assembly protein [Mesorhizobium sp. BAC0120]MDW6026033.1 TadE/TadG family type IV pilus assembly protein [Mesorhizobium sp. BAC0120]